MIDRFMDFLSLVVVNNFFYVWTTFYDDVRCVESTFMFNLHLNSFFVLSLYMTNFLPPAMLE